MTWTSSWSIALTTPRHSAPALTEHVHVPGQALPTNSIRDFPRGNSPLSHYKGRVDFAERRTTARPQLRTDQCSPWSVGPRPNGLRRAQFGGSIAYHTGHRVLQHSGTPFGGAVCCARRPSRLLKLRLRRLVAVKAGLLKRIDNAGKAGAQHQVRSTWPEASCAQPWDSTI